MMHDSKPLFPQGQLSQALDHVPVAIAVFDTEMRYLMANRSWIRDLELEGREFLGKSQYELFPKQHHGWREIYESALHGQVVRSKRQKRRTDGHMASYAWEFRPWLNDFGAIGGLTVTCAEIEQEESNAAPTDFKEPENQGIWLSPQPILGISATGRIQKASLGALEFLMPRSLFLTKSKYFELWEQPAKQAQASFALDRALQGERDLPLEMEFGSGQSYTHWSLCQIQASNTKEEDAVVALAIGVNFPAPATPLPALDEAHIAKLRAELREALESDQQSRQRETRLRNVLDMAPSGILILDERSRPIYQNEHFQRLVGRELEETQTVEDWLVVGVTLGEDREKLIRDWRERVWRRQMETVMPLVHATSKQKCELQMKPVSLPGGGMMLMVHDVTEARRTEETLVSIESRFRTVMHANPHPVVMTDALGTVFEMNAAAEEYLQTARAKSRGTKLDRWFNEPSAEAFHRHLTEGSSLEKGEVALELHLKHASEGQEKRLELKVAPILDYTGKPTSLIHFITPRKSSSSAPFYTDEVPAIEPLGDRDLGDFLLDEEPETQTLMEREVVSVKALATDSHGKIVHWSPTAEKIFGFSASAIQGQGLHRLFRPSDPTGFHMEMQFLLRGELPVEVEWTFFHPSAGKQQAVFSVKSFERQGVALELWVNTEVERERVIEKPSRPATSSRSVIEAWSPSPPPIGIPKAYVAVNPMAQLSREDLDRERLLLKESHTQIKNNLQVLSSMLNLQMSTLRNEEALDALRSSQNRVRSMALVHKLLAEVAEGSNHNFKRFTDELVIHLREAYEVGGDRVSVYLALQEERIDEAWLTPLAFSLNEMLSNVFKHAFGRDGHGEVKIQLSWNDEVGVLAVTDTGRGMASSSLEEIPSSSIGMKILRVFAGQLGGDVRTEPVHPQGVSFELHFPVRHAHLVKTDEPA